MKTKPLILCLLAIISLCVTATAEKEPFEQIKDRLATAQCVRLEFLNVIYSDIFDLVDSTYGYACLASDGRYRVTIGTDTYLFDGEYLHSYSEENNQVVVEPYYSDMESEITFITRLDDLYTTAKTDDPERFHLTLRKKTEGELPDSMTVMIDPVDRLISRLEYYDINDELNLIILLSQELDSLCNESDFSPNFPDSVEILRLN